MLSIGGLDNLHSSAVNQVYTKVLVKRKLINTLCTEHNFP